MLELQPICETQSVRLTQHKDIDALQPLLLHVDHSSLQVLLSARLQRRKGVTAELKHLPSGSWRATT